MRSTREGLPLAVVATGAGAVILGAGWFLGPLTASRWGSTVTVSVLAQTLVSRVPLEGVPPGLALALLAWPVAAAIGLLSIAPASASRRLLVAASVVGLGVPVTAVALTAGGAGLGRGAILGVVGWSTLTGAALGTRRRRRSST